MIGKTLAHYEVIALLGKGGMGEVYRARDTKLERDVAIKVLSPDMSNDEERIARFRREARTLATLQHANIASIYGFEDSPEARFLVMEVVEGEDLSERIKRGAIELDDALELARQMALGLEAAHEQGIVHRDLKPANVKVTAEGQVKILDFGLARAYQGDTGNEVDVANSPTITGALTGADTLLGTAAYMSPEQARGHTVDQRTDIWAFGVILFEMLTGQRVFDGDTVSDKLASILKSDPPWETLPKNTPPRIRELLQRCLAKHRRDRMRDIGDVRMEIEWIQQGKVESAVGGPSDGGKRIRLLPAAIAAVALAALVGFVVWTVRPDGASDAGSALVAGATHRLNLQFPSDLTVEGWLVAPDGTLSLWARPKAAQSSADDVARLYVRTFDRYELREIQGSVGGRAVCFSHDSKWIAWLAPDQASSTGLYLRKAPVDGSSPALRVLSWRDEWRWNLHWLRDGDIVTATFGNEFLRIPADGSEPGAPVPVLAEFADEFVPNSSYSTELPDGVHIFDDIEVWTEDGYSQQIAIANVNTGEAHVLVRNASSPKWVDSGHLLFSRGATVLAVRFDPVTQTIEGQPVAVADGLRTQMAWSHGEFGLTASGNLFHHPGGIVGQKRQLQWTDRDFERFEPWSEESRAFENSLRLAPDGRHLAIVIAASNGVYETWISEVSRPALRRFAFERGRDCTSRLWSPDGSHLIYASTTAGNYRLMSAALDGHDTPQLLFESTEPTVQYFPTAFADGGKLLLVARFSQGRADVMLLRLREGAATDPPQDVLLAGATNARISPGGEWLVYEADTSGRFEVYLRRWFGDGKIGPEIPVAPGGGGSPFWYRANESAPLEIWYINEGQLYAVVLKTTSPPALSRPRLVHERDEKLLEVRAAPDGRLLALVQGEDEKDPGRLNVILNWRTELEKRLEGAR